MLVFYNESDLLNHLDLSGMNYDKENLIKICEGISCCPNLMGIHFNDNNIIDKRNEDYFSEILSIFAIDDRNINELCRQKQAIKDLDNDKEINEMLLNEIH